jgi:DNA primase
MDANNERGETATPYGTDGDIMMRCPFPDHQDSTPSLSANIDKNGCWRCFGCKRKGNLEQLLAQLKSITVGEAIQQIATDLPPPASPGN